MSGRIRMTPADLRTAANTLKNKRELILEAVAAIESTVNNTTAEWEGASQSQFVQNFSEMLPMLKKDFPEKVARVVAGTAATYGCKAELNYIPIIPPTINDDAVAKFVEKTATKLVGEENVIDIGPISTGEDLGLYLEQVPGMMALVGVGNEACGAIWPQHSPKYTVDEDALLNSVMLYAQVAYDHNAQ